MLESIYLWEASRAGGVASLSEVGLGNSGLLYQQISRYLMQRLTREGSTVLFMT